MRVLVAHNIYQLRGGEEEVVAAESALLRGLGYDVEQLLISNDGISGYLAKLRTAIEVVESTEGVEKVRAAIRRFRPDVMHAHNTFPLFSPAVLGAARALGVATVQTLHNYRPVCANGLLLRRGAACEKCVDGSAYHGTVHRCYRGSLLGSLAVCRMISAHRHRGTWQHDVDAFLALTHFARNVFVRAGFPADRITVKPNAVQDPGSPEERPRSGIVFVGRLVPEKGLFQLLEAASSVDIGIRILGDGPLFAELSARAPSNVRLLGHCDREGVRSHLASAEAIVVPSLWYEGFPMVLAEAFSLGTPGIVSRIGSLAEIVADNVTGLHATAGSAAELASRIRQIAGDPAATRRMGQAARRYYEQFLTPEASKAALAATYANALARFRENRPPSKAS